MKKIFVAIALFAGITLASCGGNKATEVETAEVDSLAVDSAAADTLVVDTLTVDTVVAE